jgi:Mrp family chromosome partitioning ATPase
MGKIFEILKQADATHFSATSPGRRGQGEAALNLAEQLETDSSPLAEVVPFVEVGGPGNAIEGSPDVFSVTASSPMPRFSAKGGSGVSLHQIPLPPARTRNPDSVSVAFQPLDLIRPDEKTARVPAEIIAYHQPNHPVSKEFASLAEAIEAQLPMGGSHVLMFVGSAAGVGTTTVVINLAFTWARSDQKRIVVLDAGDTQGTVAIKFGLPASPGLAEVLAEKATLSSVLQETTRSNLFVLSSGSHGRESNSILPAKPMRDILRQLRKQFDLVLVDASSWNSEPEMSALASGCDAVYLVIPQSAAKANETTELIKTIQGQAIPLGGCVLTNMKTAISNR